MPTTKPNDGHATKSKPARASKAKALGVKTSKRRLQEIPLDRLLPHPMNANEMPMARLVKLRNNIRRTGQYPALIVRAHPEVQTAFQLLDGHHRAKVLKDLGHTTAACEVWDIDDQGAEVLLATLNRLEGQDSEIRRAELLQDLLTDIREEDLAALVPEDLPDIESSLELLTFPLDDLEADLRAQEQKANATLPHTFTVVVNQDELADIEAALAHAAGGRDSKEVRGEATARVFREWLRLRASNGDAADIEGGGPVAA